MKSYRISLIVSMVSIFFVSGYLIHIMLSYPLIGIHARNLNNGLFVVTEVYPSGWASTKPIDIGDKLYLPNLEKEHTQGVRKIEKLKSLTIIKGNEKVVFDINHQDVTAKYLFNLFFPVIFFVTNAVLSLYMLLRSKKRTRFPTLFFMIISLSYLSAGVSARDIFIGTIITSTSLLLCPVMLLHYLDAAKLNASDKVFNRSTIPIMYLLVFILSIVTNVIYVVNRAKIYYLVGFVLLTLIAISIIIFNLKSLRPKLREAKYKTILYATVPSFLPFLLLYVLPEILFREAIIPAEYTAVCLFFIPYTIVYLHLNDQVVDYGFKLKRIFFYFLISVFPSLGILTMIHFCVTDDFTFIQQLRIFIICSFLTVVFLSFKREYDCKVENRIFSKKMRFQESLLNYSELGRKSNNKEELISLLIREVQSVLSIDYVRQISYCRRNQEFLSADFELSSEINNLKVATDMNQLQIGHIIKGLRGYFLVINKSTHMYKYLYIEQKKGKPSLDNDDKTWLKTIALYTNILLQCFMYMQDILAEISSDWSGSNTSFMSFKVLTSISEEERKRLSIDIHDSILQELIFMYRELEPLVANDQNLDFLNHRLLEAIRYTREVCYDLRPPFLTEMGIVESIAALIERYQGNQGLLIDFIHCVENNELINQEVTLNIYRVIQELLNNAVKHSQADCIIISLLLKCDQLILLYEDDGVGVDLSSNIDKKKHLGITGIKERVRSIGGEIIISSSKNEGLLARVVIEIGQSY
ncbi:sensor histidine kinase [Paenibacillus sp. NPDC056722]|uniref:sensor histidine kinase n=1 Tax=Paenibacillus sp. NPDC056722 TaxID=3345924 RepID=UPI0036C3BEBB